MDAKQFYNGFICSPEIQTKYDGEDKRELLFELMEKYADYKSKKHNAEKLNKQPMEENKVFYCYEVSEQYFDICEKQCVICRSRQRHEDNLKK